MQFARLKPPKSDVHTDYTDQSAVEHADLVAKANLQATRKHAFHKPLSESDYLVFEPSSNLAANPDRTILARTWPMPFVYELHSSPRKAIKRIRNFFYRTFFYYIEPNREVRCFMDLDRPRYMPRGRQSDRHFWGVVRRLVAFWCCYLDAIYGVQLYQSGYYDGQWFLYDASSPSKHSVHVHSNLVFRNVDHLKSLMLRFIDLLECLRVMPNDPYHCKEFFYGPTNAGRYRCIVDDSVMTERPFRLPFNAKTPYVSNHFRPVLDPKTRDLTLNLTPSEHLAIGFVHPHRSIHPPWVVLPPDPGELRYSLYKLVVEDSPWPIQNGEQLDDCLEKAWQLCLKDTGEQHFQLAMRMDKPTKLELRKLMYHSELGASDPALAAYLEQLVSLIQMLAYRLDRTPEQAAVLLQMALLTSPLHTPDLVPRLCMHQPLVIPNIPDATTTTTITTTKTECWTERAFALFHVPLQKLWNTPALGDQELGEFVQDDCQQPRYQFNGEEFNRFAELPCECFSLPVQVMTFGRLRAPMLGRDPLLIRHVASLEKEILKMSLDSDDPLGRQAREDDRNLFWD